MGEKVWIFGGLTVFLVLAASPIWYTVGVAKDATGAPADLEMPLNSKECVKDKAYMVANHMDLLNQWRDAVIREGDKSTVEVEGKQYPKSLTMGCMACHTSRENFCTKCHAYADVNPTCWDCHLEPKGD